MIGTAQLTMRKHLSIPESTYTFEEFNLEEQQSSRSCMSTPEEGTPRFTKQSAIRNDEHIDLA